MATKRQAFATIEFLALASLLAIGIYAQLDAIREKEIGLRCMSNLIKIGEASRQYREDYDGYSVPTVLGDPEGDNGRVWCGGPKGTLFFSLLHPYLQSWKVWDHEPFSRTERITACQGWWSPAKEYALNNIVHTRNLLPASITVPDEHFDSTAATYWKEKRTKDVEYYGPKEERREGMGTFEGWPPTLHESEVNFPDRLVSMCENTNSFGLAPGNFIWRDNTFHRTHSASFDGSPAPSPAHGNTYTTLFCDGHVEALTEEDIRFAVMWNNSPNEDGGLWNRNRSASEEDDVYHPAWIPVACQLNTDPKKVLRNFYFYPTQQQTIFDVDGTYGEYNTIERPDAKYDE